MALVVHKELLTEEIGKKLENICPFCAIKYENNNLTIGMSCKLCKLCVKNSNGFITYEEDVNKNELDKSQWNGITVFCEHNNGVIHKVTFELIGKAKELGKVIGHKVQVLVIGYNVSSLSKELFAYGADEVYIYDNKKLENFLLDPYTNIFENYINNVKPSSILVGATSVGRALAPRVAARLHTGLTADCTKLEMKENTDLVQIRPAFGGNIMAEILTPATRPQFCTVRYKIFSAPKPNYNLTGTIKKMDIKPHLLNSRSEIISIITKPQDIDISEADIIIQVGRGIKNKTDMAMIEKLATLLNGTIACTRPLVENGWFDGKHQIGLSGRTVKPKLLITIGVSGAIQTVAGMKGSDCIIAINKDPEALIFDVAHYGFVGDLYEIVPLLIKNLEGKN
ncbi:MAG: electron transfer flavoprotein subunit alpha/FixB family protein [Sphaerochaetaceae bacterium]|nr:electron transfer flavoprotein subunit alpha/FixB family protein [Sphaerochaetaceae bacterium]